MVTSGLRQQAPASNAGDQNQTGGLSLAIAAMPSPEQIGPVGAYLGSDAFAWSTGNIIFSNGSEVAPIEPPRLLEVARTVDVAALAHALDVVIPAAFVPAEAAQGTNGASNGRFTAVFDEDAPTPGATTSAVQSCLVVTDDPRWQSALSDALASRGVKCVGIGSDAPATDFVGAAAQLAAGGARRRGDRRGRRCPLRVGVGVWWRGGGVAAGARRARGHRRRRPQRRGVGAGGERPRGRVRPACCASSTVTDATTSGGRSRAQAAAQLSRAAHLVADVNSDAFAIGVETDADSRDIDRR